MYVQIYTYIYINEPLFCTPETNTALYINYTSILKKRIERRRGRDDGYIEGIVQKWDDKIIGGVKMGIIELKHI